jgi:hypothetical protein
MTQHSILGENSHQHSIFNIEWQRDTAGFNIAWPNGYPEVTSITHERMLKYSYLTPTVIILQFQPSL